MSRGQLPNLLPVNVGVPQGSFLGPLLFSHFIDDICGAVHTSNHHLYADDFQVYAEGPPCGISDCIHRLNDVDLEAIFRWSVENGLSLNSGKTQAMIICRDRGQLPAMLPAVLVDERTVPYSASVKNLGLTMDNRFSWRDQVNCVRRNVGFILSRLWQFADVNAKKACSITCDPPFFIL
jgi:hypothetical protein